MLRRDSSISARQESAITPLTVQVSLMTEVITLPPLFISHLLTFCWEWKLDACPSGVSYARREKRCSSVHNEAGWCRHDGHSCRKFPLL